MIHNNPIHNEESQKTQKPKPVHKDQDRHGDEVFLLEDAIRVRRKIRTVPIKRYEKLQIVSASTYIEQQ